jgi:hypothetical protein
MKTAIAVAIGLLLPNITWGQQYKTFHVTEVKQYQSDPECTPSGTGTVCTIERWRVSGYTDKVDYQLACWEAATTGKDGKILSDVKCNPMSVGEDIEVQVFPSALAYPPIGEDKKPDYSWYMVQTAKERTSNNKVK